MPRLSPLTRSVLAYHGLQVFSLYQPQHLFVDDGRKLKRCAQPCDPWQATVFEGPSYLSASHMRTAIAATADEAALAAVRGPGDLRAALMHLSLAVVDLIASYVDNRGD